VTLWNIVQAVQIDNLTHRAALTDTETELQRQRARYRDEDLAGDVDRLRLVTEALWSLCSERLGVTDDDLRERILAIDRADGVVDGRHAAAPPRPCPACEAMVPADRATCQFCGAAAPGQSLFD
jgi:hypothetical protein